MEILKQKLKLGRLNIKPRRLIIRERRKIDIDDVTQFYLFNVSEVVLTIYDVKSDENDYKFLGSISDASKLGYYTVPFCQKIGEAVTKEELMTAKNFAQLRKCKRQFYLGGAKPCVPVFYRGTDAMSKYIEGRSCLWVRE